jgi:hypothetical protein
MCNCERKEATRQRQGQTESCDWRPDNARGPISAHNVTLVPNSRDNGIMNMRRNTVIRARCCQIFLYHVSPRAPINRERRGVVLAYALKAPEGHYVSVDYVLVVSLFCNTSSSICDFYFDA